MLLIVLLPFLDLKFCLNVVCAEVLRKGESARPPMLVYGRLIPVREDVGRDIKESISHSETLAEDLLNVEP
jgi:hypothetical protein